MRASARRKNASCASQVRGRCAPGKRVRARGRCAAVRAGQARRSARSRPAGPAFLLGQPLAERSRLGPQEAGWCRESRRASRRPPAARGVPHSAGGSRPAVARATPRRSAYQVAARPGVCCLFGRYARLIKSLKKEDTELRNTRVWGQLLVALSSGDATSTEPFKKEGTFQKPRNISEVK